MDQSQPQIRGFRAVFTIIGVIYMILASSMLVRGVAVLRDFAVPESAVSAPVLEDFFLFFYQLMGLIGVLMILFGWITHGHRDQRLVSVVFCVASLLIAWRDLSTSDSRFGNRLYRGEATLVFVYIGLAFAAAFGWLAMRRSRVSNVDAKRFIEDRDRR
jgi:hypothetical protein